MSVRAAAQSQRAIYAESNGSAGDIDYLIIAPGSSTHNSKFRYAIIDSNAYAVGHPMDSTQDLFVSFGASAWHIIAVADIDRSDLGAGQRQVKMYIDGISEPMTDTAGSSITGVYTEATVSLDSSTFGARKLNDGSFTHYFTHFIDDFRIYNRELTPAEVAAIGTPADNDRCYPYP